MKTERDRWVNGIRFHGITLVQFQAVGRAHLREPHVFARLPHRPRRVGFYRRALPTHLPRSNSSRRATARSPPSITSCSPKCTRSSPFPASYGPTTPRNTTETLGNVG